MCGIETITERQANLADQADNGDQWLTPGRFGVLLGLLVVATFPGVTLLGQSFVLGDFGAFSYPLAYFHRQSFWRGELPLWNPLNHCGLPFLAQWNTLTLYPPSLLYLFLPMPWSVSFFCVAHLFWGGLGMYFLAQRWTQYRWAGGLAGIVFAFNGLTIHSLIWPSQEATWSWVPWVLLLTQNAWRYGRRRLVWATLAAAMQMLAAGPETILLTWFILLLLAIADCTARNRAGAGSAIYEKEESLQPLATAGSGVAKAAVPRCSVRGPTISRPEAEIVTCPTVGLLWQRFFVVAFIVALVCAAQLLPFMELLAHSQRDSGYGSSNQWAMPIWGWINFLVPLFRTGSTPQGVVFQTAQSWVTSYYAGVGTVFLSAVAVVRVKAGRVRLLAALVFIGLVLALGNSGILYRVLRTCVPAVGFVRFPVKLVILVLALVPILSAIGMKHLDGRRKQLGRFELGTAGVIILFIVAVIIWDWRSDRDDWATPWRAVLWSGITRSLFLVLILLLLGLFLRATQRRRIICGCALLVIFWLDFATHVPYQSPTVPPSAYSPGWARGFLHWASGPMLGEARAMVAPVAHRVLLQYMHPNSNPEEPYLIFRLAMLPNCNLLDEVPLSHGFFPLVPREANLATMLPYARTNVDFSPLLDFMGVSRITAPSRMFDWELRPTAMPLVSCGQRPVFTNNDCAIEAFSATNVDYRKVVFLPPDARNRICETNNCNARVLGSEFENQRVSIRTESSAPALLVVSQSYYPAWKAYVDGRQVKIWRANYAFQAIEVPGGRHRIELRYEDGAFVAGAVLSFLGLAACVAMWLKGP